MDIAELGFKAETSDLEKASASLNKLKAAAGGVSTATNKVSRTVTSTSLSVARAKTAEANAVLKALQATKNANRADIEKATSALKVARAEEAKAKSLDAAAMANDRLTRSTLKVIEAEKKQGVTRKDVVAISGVSNDNMPNRFNTANIAAQFQDIGVTAAMGMNPLTIALQQGTQLSAILNNMKNPLQGLKAAFVSVLNPVSLLSIGMIALVTSLIQIVDWGNFVKKSLNTIADGLEAIGPYAIAAAAGLALFFAPAIITGLLTATTAITTMGTAALLTGAKIAGAWLLANPVTLIAALVATGAAIAVWAVKTIEPFRNFANTVIGIFKGLGFIIYGSMLSVFELINNAVGTLLNNIVDIFNTGLNALPDIIKEKLNIGNIDIEFGTSTNGVEAMKKGGALVADSFKSGFDSSIEGEDYVGKIGDAVDGALGSVADKFREWGASIGDASKETAKKAADAWATIVRGAESTIMSLRAEGKALRMNSLDAAKLRNETRLLSQAMQQGITLTDDQKKQIKELSGEMGNLEESNRKYREALEFDKSTFKSFISSMKNDLEEGKSIWESFGNAVKGVLNKIQDRLLDQSVDILFNAMQGGGSSSGGLIDSVLGMFGNGSGGGFLNSITGMLGNFGGFFADGGDFTGGKPIVVGERGPEIMLPRQSGTVIPNSGVGGSNIRVMMNINTPDANSFRQSQPQIIAGMANQIEIAKKRNL